MGREGRGGGGSKTKLEFTAWSTVNLCTFIIFLNVFLNADLNSHAAGRVNEGGSRQLLCIYDATHVIEAVWP